MPTWGFTLCSLCPVFPHPFVPSVWRFLSPRFYQPNVPSTQCFFSSMFPQQYKYLVKLTVTGYICSFGYSVFQILGCLTFTHTHMHMHTCMHACLHMAYKHTNPAQTHIQTLILTLHSHACIYTHVQVPFNLALIDERGLMTELLTILQSYFIIAMSVRLNQNMQLTGTPGQGNIELREYRAEDC